MARISYGDQVKERTRRLLEALLSYAGGEFEDADRFDIQVNRQTEHQLVFRTKLRVLELLTIKDAYEGSLTKAQIRESLNRMQDFLGILEDNRTTTKGSEDWHFTLKLWHKDKEANLRYFDQEWDNHRPEKSKQFSTQSSLVKAVEQSLFIQPLHNLPQPDYGKFIGREQELTKAMKILRPYPHSQHSLVTIDGVGGIGKSALALEIAHLYLREAEQLQTEDRFDALVWTPAKQTVLQADTGITTRYQALRTLNDICESIAVTLKIEDQIRSHVRDKVELIRRNLTQQRVLLIVDNLETVDDEAVISFLQELPAPTKALVTTRHRIDVAYPVRLVGMKWEEAKTLIEQECIKKEVRIAEEQQRRLHDRTGGVPLAIVWSIAQVGFGYSVEMVLTKLGNPKGDIARFCFESAVEKIKDKDAYKLLLALALCSNEGSREELGYVAGFGEDLIGRDEGLVKLEKLSLVNKRGERFSMLPLTREYAEHELQIGSDFSNDATRRLIDYHLQRSSSSTASGYLVRHKNKLSKDTLKKFLDVVVEQFWAEATGYMDDQNLHYHDPYSLCAFLDGVCFRWIETMEKVGQTEGIQKLKESWDQIWNCDNIFWHYANYYNYNSSPVQDFINAIERLGEHEFLVEKLAKRGHRGYASEMLQVIEKSGRKELIQPLRVLLNEEPDGGFSVNLRQVIERLESLENK